jgi:hypothetical protein
MWAGVCMMIVASLGACGGGGGGSTISNTTSNTAPISNAGLNQNVIVGTVATFHVCSLVGVLNIDSRMEINNC